MSTHSLAQIGVDVEAKASDAGAEVEVQTGKPNAREPRDFFVERNGLRYAGSHLIIDLWDAEHLDDLGAVELALELRPRTVLDVGTGSGAIALAIADELPGCEVTATDTSTGALEVARANAGRLGLTERVRLVEGTLPSGSDDFDLVVANLPYVSEAEWAGLMPEIVEWEPREALLAGPDGLDAIRSVLPECAQRLRRSAANEPGVLALEVGEGQAGVVATLLGETGARKIESRRDLAGIPRVVVGEIA